MAVASDAAFAGSIPEIYDRLLVPLIFEGYARDIVQRVADLQPKDVLEIAAGTGVATRELTAQLPSGTRLTATDLNQPMLERAKTKHPPDNRIEWRQADALSLPFEEGAFDVVVCQFGAMFFPDKMRAYREARRVLRPGGRFVFNVWDHIEENEFADVITKALALRFPADPPRFLARIPHGYNDVARISADLHGAGFSDVAIDTVEKKSSAASPRVPATAYCQGTPLRAEIEARDLSGLEAATDHAAAALTRSFGPDPIEGRIQAIVIAARKVDGGCDGNKSDDKQPSHATSDITSGFSGWPATLARRPWERNCR